MLSGDDKHAEIKRLYYSTTKQTIQQDLDKALDLLKSMGSEAERERVAVYMDGLAQMRAEWARADRRRQKPVAPSRAPKARRPATAPRKAR
jgi:hypothetical protein